MHKHGIIVFVHNSGGSKEIIVDEFQEVEYTEGIEKNVLHAIVKNQEKLYKARVINNKRKQTVLLGIKSQHQTCTKSGWGVVMESMIAYI